MSETATTTTTTTTTTTLKLRSAPSEDSGIDLDGDLDVDIRRMSLDAMKLLNSITDEVQEMDHSTPSKRSISPSSHGSPVPNLPHADVHDMVLSEISSSKQLERATPSPTKKDIKHINDIDVGDESEHDDDDDDLSFDGSFVREMEALNNVAAEIERELSTQDSHTMQKAMLELQHSPKASLRERIIDLDDREIIRKALEEEMLKAGVSPKQTAWERCVHQFQTDEGFGSQETTLVLVCSAALVWSIVAGLIYKSLSGEMV